MSSILPVVLSLYPLSVIAFAGFVWDPRAKRFVIPLSLFWPIVCLVASIYGIIILLAKRSE